MYRIELSYYHQYISKSKDSGDRSQWYILHSHYSVLYTEALAYRILNIFYVIFMVNYQQA